MNWLRLDSTRDLIDEMPQDSDLSLAFVNSIYGGRTPGTYVCKEFHELEAHLIHERRYADSHIEPVNSIRGGTSQGSYTIKE